MSEQVAVRESWTEEPVAPRVPLSRLGRQAIVWLIIFLAILPPHGPYVLWAAYALIVFVVPYWLVMCWVFPPLGRLSLRALRGAWRWHQGRRRPAVEILPP